MNVGRVPEGHITDGLNMGRKTDDYRTPDNWVSLHNQPMDHDLWADIAQAYTTNALACLYLAEHQALLLSARDDAPHLNHQLITDLAVGLAAIEEGCRTSPLAAVVLDSIEQPTDDDADLDDEGDVAALDGFDDFVDIDGLIFGGETDARSHAPLLARSLGDDWPGTGPKGRRLTHRQATKPFLDSLESLQRLGCWQVATVAAAAGCNVRGPALSLAMACDWLFMDDWSETRLEDPFTNRYPYICAISMTARRVGVVEAAALLSGGEVHGPVQETFFNGIVDELTNDTDHSHLLRLLRSQFTLGSENMPEMPYVSLLIARKARRYIARAQLEADFAASQLWFKGDTERSTQAYVDLLFEIAEEAVDRDDIEKATRFDRA